MTVGAGSPDSGAAGQHPGPTTTGPAGGTAPPAAPLRPGDPRRLGAYHLLGRLGEGGMGTVFLARSGDGQLVAVKVVRPEYSQDEGFRERFRREAAAAQRVARFCTAQVLAAGIEGDISYLVTEYIDGPTLAAAVARDGPLRGSMLDSMAIGVAAALSGIHAAGVVHRDLKPSNVLLSRVGPKVIDFGIARALDGLDGLTLSGQLVGTPAYMAPEQVHGVVTAATDVFAWGAVVAFAGTGRSPFGTGSPYELMRRVAMAEPDLADLDGRLRELVELALRKEPAERPSARGLLLAQVGDVDDPVGASTQIVRAAWTPPPATPPLPDAPTVPADPGRQRARRARWPGRVVGAVAVLVAAVGLALGGSWIAALGETDGGPGSGPESGQSSQPVADDAGSEDRPDPRNNPQNDPQNDPENDPEDRGGDGPGSGDPQVIALGDRVPATGFTALAVGEVHRYRFEVAADQQLYLKGMVETCAHLLPWVLTDRDGGTLANGTMACRTDGPLSVAKGEYELRIGGDNVDGEYAFQLTGP